MSIVATKDYGRQYRPIWDEILSALKHSFFEDEPILGFALSRFEKALARYHGTEFAVGVGSGTDAIVLTLRALGIGEGDEVITSAHTYSGVISAILLAGARPLLVDADAELGLLHPDVVKGAITPRTRAILGCHFYGHPVDATALADLAQRRGLVFLEDAAQAQGARWHGRPVGSFGKAAILSFHPSKNLGALGDGGAILTSDPELVARLRVARNLGKDDEYRFTELGFDTKLDTVQAAILEVKLRYLEEWIMRRRGLADIYLEGLEGVGDLLLPKERPEARHAYHLFVVRTEQRDKLCDYLGHHGIKVGLHYPIAAHRQPAFARHFAGARFPNAENFARTAVSLPLSHEHEPSEIRRVVERVRFFYGS